MKARKKPSSKAAVILTQRALADLRAVKQYSLETWGRRTADKYLDGISSALDRLRATPHILQDLPDFATGLYFYRVGKHYLACDFDGSTIIVL